MSRDYQSLKLGKDTYGDVLRKHFRNGLAHGFSVCHGGFEGAPGDNYFKPAKICGVQSLEINPSDFFDDYAVAFERYLADLRKGNPKALFFAFDRTFKRIFIDGK